MKIFKNSILKKKNCRIVVVCGGGCVPNSVCEETISTKINSRTQEVGSTDSKTKIFQFR